MVEEAMELKEVPLLYAPQHETSISAWLGHRGFAQRLIKELRPESVVELGVHAGDSYFTIVEAMQKFGIVGRAFGVDTWTGDKHAGYYGTEIWDLVQKANASYCNFSTLVRMTFDEFAESIDGPISLLHIDGLHTYEAVKHDFDTWVRKVSDVVLLHDICVPENPDFGVWRLWNEIKESWGADRCFEFHHCHGLAVLCKTDKGLEAIMRATRLHQ